MSNITKFNTGDMKNTASFLREQSEEYTQIYKQLIEAASTMGAAWDDPANKQYVASINECTTQLRAMAEKLDAVAEIINKQAQGYINLSEANVAAVPKH